MIDEIRYIFKLRIGCDGSRETLSIRNLITDDELPCHWCGTVETRKHIIEECELYRHSRRRLKAYIENDDKFTKISNQLSLLHICLYSFTF